MNPEKLSSHEILAIKTPENLFDKNKIKLQFMKLRKLWHPDYCSLPESGDVFHHIQQLKVRADELIKKGIWNKDGEIEFMTADGKRYVFRFLKKKEIGVGIMFIGAEKIMFMIKQEFEDLYKQAKHSIIEFPFKNKQIEKEFQKFLPIITFAEKLNGDGFIMLIKKHKDAYSLADLIDYHNGKLEPKQVAWIGSGLFNLAAMFEVSGMTYNGFTSDAIFVKPDDHTIYLLGGWWYSGKVGSMLKAIPSKMARVLPRQLYVEKRMDSCYDGIQIRSTLIEALGDKTMLGSSLLKSSDIPKPILAWLRGIDTGNAVKRYDDWFKVLKSAFGKRKFIEMKIDSNKIYRR
jgi:hypothetical protein